MTNSTFPVSFKDPVYASADAAASDAAGIPPGLLQSVRLAGEKSNANQTSSAGATTPYQFTPDTRQLIIKKYGIDPTASPQAAALGAAYLLKEGMDRTGSVAGGVTQYIGGTDPSNWGGQTRAYTNRVMAAFTKGGGQDTPQADATPTPSAAPLPSAASYGLDPSVVGLGGAPTQAAPTANVTAPTPVAPGAGVANQIVADYNSGRLSSADMDAVDKRVSAGKLQIDPSQLVRPAPQPAQPQAIGPKTLAAMQNGTLSPDQLKTVQDGIANGTLIAPAQAAAPAMPAAPDPTAAPAGTPAAPSSPGMFQTGPVGALDADGFPVNQHPVTAAQNSSTVSDVAEQGAGGVVGGLLDIAGAGGRLVGAKDFANQMQQTHEGINAQLARDTSGSIAGKAANVVGGAVPYLASGGTAVLPVLAGGAAAGAIPAIAANKGGLEITRDALLGAGMGAAGQKAGKLLGSVASSIAENPTVARGIAKAQEFFGKSPSAATTTAAAGGVADANTAGEIAAASGNTPGGLATKLEQAPGAQTPGYTPSAAELAGDANVSAVHQGSVRAQGPTHAVAEANNDAAIQQNLAAPEGTPPSEVALQQADAAQDALTAQGQKEVAPLPQTTAQTLQAPQYAAPIKLARRMAADEGSPVFDNLETAKQQDAANTLKQIIGTPEQLEAMKAERGAQAADDYLTTHVGIPVDSPQVQSLLAKPAMKKALSAAQEAADNTGSGGIFTNGGTSPLLKGSGAQTPIKYVSGQGLVAAKAALDDQISAAAQAGENAQVNNLMGVKSQLLNYLDKAIPDYGTARANYAQASGPIDAMQAVQQRLYSAVDPATGEVSSGKLVNAINSIKGEQIKPGIRPADKVPNDTMDALAALAQHLQNKSDLTGLPAEGQEYIRRALASSDKHAAAHADFQDVLNSQSPAYTELHGAHAQNVAAAKSQQAVEEAMQKLNEQRLNAQGGIAVDKSSIDRLRAKYGAAMTPADAARFDAAASDLQRSTIKYSRLGRIAGSDTAQNQSTTKRTLATVGDALKDRAVQGLIGATVGSAGGLGGTAIGGAVGVIAPAVLHAVTNKVSAISTENAAKLLTNGKMLASALRNYESLAARRAFIQGLTQKAGFAAGVSTGNALSNRSGQ